MTDSEKKRTATIHVLKEEAARRQLCAAVRMFFLDMDELAIHTVASAAYSILRDLKPKHGRNEAGDYYLNMIFYAVRSYRRGKLPRYLSDDPAAMQWIRDMAENFPFITATSRFKDITAHPSPDIEKEYYRNRNKVANFLKHADRDHASSIATDQIDNLELLMLAISAYVDLMDDDLRPEGALLLAYANAEFGTTEDIPEHIKQYASTLQSIPHRERKKFCTKFLKELDEFE